MADLARVLTWPEGEAELVTELRSGSESAFDWLVTHYHGPVYGLLAGMLNDPSEAADVTQEVFLVMVRGISTFDRQREGSFRAWVRGITVNVVRNYRRRQFRKPAVALDAGIAIVAEAAKPGPVVVLAMDRDRMADTQRLVATLRAAQYRLTIAQGNVNTARSVVDRVFDRLARVLEDRVRRGRNVSRVRRAIRELGRSAVKLRENSRRTPTRARESPRRLVRGLA